MKNDNGLTSYNKCLGAFLGAAIGDALGWPYEMNSNNVDKNIRRGGKFVNWTRRAAAPYYTHLERIQQGEYSDDTQLIFSTARSLEYGKDWSKYFTRVELPMWLLYERGGGWATKRAAKIWSQEQEPWSIRDNKTVSEYFNAGGNGVAMRILPHVFGKYNNLEELLRNIFINGIATHGHPRALLGAMLYAQALHYLFFLDKTLEYGDLVEHLLQDTKWKYLPDMGNFRKWWDRAISITNGRYLDSWNETVKEIEQGLLLIRKSLSRGSLDNINETLKALNCFDKKVNGAGTVSALIAIYIFSKRAISPKTGILDVCYIDGADTDTLASMVGGLMGILYGTEWIEADWNNIQDYDYIDSLVKDLIYNSNIDAKKLINEMYWTDTKSSNIKNLLKKKSDHAHLYFGNFGNLNLISKQKLDSLIDSIEVIQYKFRTKQNQTVYLKTFTKKSERENKYNKPVPNNLNSTSIILDKHKLELIKAMVPARVTASKLLEVLILLIDYNSQGLSKMEIMSKIEKRATKSLDKEMLLKINEILTNKEIHKSMTL